MYNHAVSQPTSALFAYDVTAGGGFAIPFFSERQISAIPLDKTKCVRCEIPRNEHCEIPIPVFSERHVAVIPFDKMKLYVRAGGGGNRNPGVLNDTTR